MQLLGRLLRVSMTQCRFDVKSSAASLYFMSELIASVTLHKVANILIGLRLKDMRARHDCLFYYQISDAAPSEEAMRESGAANYLPPRRQWIRPARADRAGLNHDAVVRKGIWKTIATHLRGGTLDSTLWGQQLLSLHAEIQEAFNAPENTVFTPPDVLLIKKAETGKYRIMAPCANIKERIISGILARYFEDLIESVLDDSCYSFRMNGQTLHDAILNLQTYSQNNTDKMLYVAECDLRGFFDSLCHDVAIDAVKYLASIRHITIDPGAMVLLNSLLRSYSFPGYALPKALEKLKDNTTGCIDWLSPQERNKIYGKIADTAIGIPQGNPISPVLANAALTFADKQVKSVLGTEGFYARYCDDIILLHPDRKICDSGLKAYYHAITKLRLPAHPAEIVVKYSKSHYNKKSRKPYPWGDDKSMEKAMPWIQFVGYQLHRDGIIRIRKQSINNQKMAINKVVATARKIVHKSKKNNIPLKLDPKKIYCKVIMRLVRAGLGDRRPKAGTHPIAEPCWIDAFPLIERNPWTEKQMRELDRHREIASRKFKYWLVNNDNFVENNEFSGRNKEKRPEPFYGAPYSYYCALDREKNRIRDFNANYGNI